MPCLPPTCCTAPAGQKVPLLSGTDCIGLKRGAITGIVVVGMSLSLFLSTGKERHLPTATIAGQSLEPHGHQDRSGRRGHACSNACVYKVCIFFLSLPLCNRDQPHLHQNISFVMGVSRGLLCGRSLVPAVRR